MLKILTRRRELIAERMIKEGRRAFAREMAGLPPAEAAAEPAPITRADLEAALWRVEFLLLCSLMAVLAVQVCTVAFVTIVAA